MESKKKRDLRDRKFEITVCKNGPYLVSGGVPLLQKIIQYDVKSDSCQWEEGKTFPQQETYTLCRCGESRNKPFCDGTHLTIKFRGKETASHTVYRDNAVTLDGPELKLTDAELLCASARFCHRAGGIWNILRTSDNPQHKKIAIEEAADCPSGRLIVYDKTTGKPIEPPFEPSIALIEDPYIKTMGPLWVRGGIPVISADGKSYEIRNRITLCRCGKSRNKPFCDSSHWPDTIQIGRSDP
jgi:CDGSH-type Zn-finger protein